MAYIGALHCLKGSQRLLNLLRNGHSFLQQKQPVMSSFLFTHKNCLTTTGGTFAFLREQQGRVSQLSTADEFLRSIETKRRRYRNIDPLDIKYCMETFQKEGVINPQQSFDMIRYTGKSLVVYSAKERQKMFHNVWQQLEQMYVKKTIPLINAALRVMLENEEFPSAAFLETMQNVQANSYTFELLYAHNLRVGNKEQASKILEHINNGGMSLGVTGYNALITYYLYSGKENWIEDELENLLVIMKDSDVQPTCDTYEAIMIYHAANGDYNGIKSAISAAVNEGTAIYPRNILNLTVHLVMNGHSNMTKQILELIPSNSGYVSDALNVIYKLIGLGFDDAAMQVANYIKNTNSDDHYRPIGNKFIRALIFRNRPVAILTEKFEELVEHGHIANDPSIVLYHALLLRNISMVMELFEYMDKQNIAISSLHLRRLFYYCERTEDIPFMYAALKSLIEIPNVPNKYGNVYFECILKLYTLGESHENVVKKLKENDLSELFCNFVEMMWLVRDGKFEESMKMMEGKTLMPNCPVFGINVEQGLQNDGHWQEIPAFLAKLSNVITRSQPLENNVSNIVGRTLHFMSTKYPAMVEDFINQLKQHDIRILRTHELAVLEQITTEISDECKETLKKLCTRTYDNVSTLGNKPSNISSIDELEVHLGSHTVDQTDLKRRLLPMYIESGRLDEADDIKQELDKQGYKYGPFMLEKIGHLAALRDRFREAQTCRHVLEQKHSDHQMDVDFIISLSASKVRNGLFEEGLSELKKYFNSLRRNRRHNTLCDPSKSSIQNLLDACYSCSSPLQTIQLIEMLSKYTNHITYDVLEELMIVLLDRGDTDNYKNLEAAVTALNMAVKVHQCCPHYTMLIQELIKNDKVSFLQQVVDAVCKILPEADVLTGLLFDFIECGNPHAAQSVFNTGRKQFFPSTHVLSERCSSLVSNKNITALESFVQVTKEIRAIDREVTLFHLMRGYAECERYPQALGVLDVLEEENIRPRDRTLQYLQGVLQSAGMDVPFSVPVSNDHPSVH